MRFSEPSSALASKVLRAWDNPSPPPSPPLSPGLPRNQTEAIGIDAEIPLDIQRDKQSVQGISEVPTENVYARPTLQSSSIVEDPAEPPEEADLINFDSLESPTIAPIVNLLLATPPSSSLNGPLTVDDLLAPSPFRSLDVHATPTQDQDSAGPVASGQPNAREDTASTEEEAQVLMVLSGEPPQGSSSSAPTFVPSDMAQVTEVSVADVSLEPEPYTPLRRSTRPRRSVSPYFNSLTATLSKSTNATSSASPSHQKIEVGPARKKRSKARDSDSTHLTIESTTTTSPALNIPLEENQVGAGQGTLSAFGSIAEQGTDGQAKSKAGQGSGKQRPSKPSHQQLRSLSPNSARLLMQLLPSPSESTLNPNSMPTPEIESQSIAQNTGLAPEDSVDTQCALLPTENQDHARPSTPVRNGTSPMPCDIGRTPARRIPISEAMAQGIASPVKPPTFLQPSKQSAVSGQSGFSGSSVFKLRGPEEPPRSPAKRVPISEIVSVFSSPAKTVSRPVPPVKSTHVRSMSEDPIQPAVPKFLRSMSAEPARPSQSALRAGNLFRQSAQSSATKTSQPISDSSSTVPLNIPPSIQEIDESEPPPPPAASKPVSTLRVVSTRAESKIPRPEIKPYARPTVSNANRQIPRPTVSIPQKILLKTAASAPLAVSLGLPCGIITSSQN
jgi:hypothetical protein